MKIVTDAAADLSPDEAVNLGITVAPLFINFPEGEIRSTDITPDDFYNRLEAMAPQIPTTAQPSPGLFQEIFEREAASGDEIISVSISSGLSGTIQSVRLGAQTVTSVPITVVDSMTLSGGERFQVLAAAAAAKAGWATTKIVELLKQIQQQTEVIYTLETLEYLSRGGRIGRVQALAGTLLGLKPIINVSKTDGKYSTIGKARTLPRAQTVLADYLVHQYAAKSVWVTVLHGRFAQEADALTATLRERLNCAKMELMRISPVLGVHTGPGIVGAAVMPMALVSDLM
jgi:DegV family protein with EDD domain